MSEYKPLAGQVAAVTGASRGIGRAIAELLAQRGADVSCGDRLVEKAKETAAAIAEATGQRARFYCLRYLRIWESGYLGQ